MGPYQARIRGVSEPYQSRIRPYQGRIRAKTGPYQAENYIFVFLFDDFCFKVRSLNSWLGILGFQFDWHSFCCGQNLAI